MDWIFWLIRLIILIEIFIIGFGIGYLAVEMVRWIPYWWLGGKDD